MRYSKFILIAFLAFVSSLTVNADGISPELARFRSSIKQFLQEEGFMPSIDEQSNSLNFKKEGVPYWIALDGYNPVYVEFHRSGLDGSETEEGFLLNVINEVNKNMRCAKVVAAEDKTISIAVEMYCHSAEEFKYVFYKNLAELETAKNMVLQLYNDTESADSTYADESTASAVSSSSALSRFFPVYGMMLGQASVKDMKTKGYTVKKMDSGSQYCDIKGLTFWDHDKDNVFEHIYITNSDIMPDQWETQGLTWSLSYNQILAKFKSWGYSINIDKAPTTKTYSGRNTLSADVTATSADGHLIFVFDFDYGNDNGEGYTTSSKNSLYSITIKTE